MCFWIICLIQWCVYEMQILYGIITVTFSREISKARTKERGNNNLSMPKQLLPLRRRRKICLRCLASLVVN
jgi:hypothetical protein